MDLQTLPLSALFEGLGLSLALGLLVGLERERSGHPLAGLRTFALLALFGSVSLLLAERFGGWVLAANGLAVLGVAAVGNLLQSHRAEHRDEHEVDPGQTTEVAMLLVYALGAYCMVGDHRVVAALAGVTVVLLGMRERLHAVTDALDERDLRAILRFVLLSLVILPILPDRTYGPYDVLNPFEIWLMVVLIVGISLGGYLAYRFLGDRAGTVLSGVFGGLVSSTATTVAHSRRARTHPEAVPAAALVLALASAVVFVRIAVEIAVVEPPLLREAAWPLATVAVVYGAGTVVLWLRRGVAEEPVPEPDNPTELRAALIFGALYALVLFAAAAAKEHLGNQGLYAVAVISGLTDVDAITLSTAQLVNDGRVDADTAWRVILTATLMNLVFKGGVAGVLGGRRLLGRVALVFGACLVAGGLVIFFWPG